jgi:hypothetical protein
VNSCLGAYVRVGAIMAPAPISCLGANFSRKARKSVKKMPSVPEVSTLLEKQVQTLPTIFNTPGSRARPRPLATSTACKKNAPPRARRPPRPGGRPTTKSSEVQSAFLLPYFSKSISQLCPMYFGHRVSQQVLGICISMSAHLFYASSGMLS